MGDVLTIKLTGRQRELILKYGYPFEEIEHQLRSTCTRQGRVGISDAAYWWEQVAGNLSISINEDVEDDDLVNELDEVCGLVESHLAMHRRRASHR